MVNLDPVQHDDEFERAPTFTRSAGDPQVFALSVDEPPGGPIVIKVAGDLGCRAATALRHRVTDAVSSGRSVIVDLLDVDGIERSGHDSFRTAAATLSECGRAGVVVRNPEIGAAMTRFGVPSYRNQSEAITAALLRMSGDTASEHLPPAPLIGPRDALRGTYL